MLTMAMNVSWREKFRNEALYGKLQRVTDKIRERRLRLAGHCIRHSELEVSKLVLWEPIQGKSSRESQRLTYVDMLRRDTRLESTVDFRSLRQDTWTSADGEPWPEEARHDDDDENALSIFLSRC